MAFLSKHAGGRRNLCAVLLSWYKNAKSLQGL